MGSVWVPFGRYEALWVLSGHYLGAIWARPYLGTMGPPLNVLRQLRHAWGFRGTIWGAEGTMGVLKARHFVSSLYMVLAMVVVMHCVKGDRVLSAPAYGADDGWGAGEVG